MAESIILTEKDLIKERNKLQKILNKIERLEDNKTEIEETIRVLERMFNTKQKIVDPSSPPDSGSVDLDQQSSPLCPLLMSVRSSFHYTLPMSG